MNPVYVVEYRHASDGLNPGHSLQQQMLTAHECPPVLFGLHEDLESAKAAVMRNGMRPSLFQIRLWEDGAFRQTWGWGMRREYDFAEVTPRSVHDGPAQAGPRP